MMKVAFINTVAGFNATGRMCEDLANANGVEGKIFYGRKEYEGNVPSYKFNNLIGNSIHAISTFLLDNHAFVNKSQTLHLIENLKEFKPDIIHLHNLHGYYLDVEVLFKYLKQLDIPVILTLHDCWTMTGHCAHFDSIGCEQWKTCCKSCPISINYPPTFNKFNVEKNYNRKNKVFNSLDNLTIVCPSFWLASIVKESYLKEHDVRVINNGIDLSLFSCQNKATNRRVELLAVASVWTKNKGLYDLAEFSKLLDDRHHLTIVGITDKQQRLFPDTVTCLQRTNNRDELIELYNKADYFLNFTYEDTFPTVNIESLACGTPVITYNTGGSPEIIDNTSGIVIEKGNYKQVLTILESRAHLSSFDCVNRARKFDKTTMINNYLDLYNEKLHDCDM